MIPIESLYDRLTSRDIKGANCAGVDVDIMTEFVHFRDAQRVCHRCPVSASLQCFSNAVEHDEVGTWGGAWFGYWLAREARGSTKGHRRNIAPTSRGFIEQHSVRLARAMGISLDEYVVRYGSPSSTRAFKKALNALKALRAR